MACKDAKWHEVYQTYMGKSVGVCVQCGYKMTQEGIFDIFAECPVCKGKKKEDRNVANNS